MATEDERAGGFGNGQDAASVRLEAKIDALLGRRWTDERLDDLAKRVDDGFKEVRGDITRLDGKFDERFARPDAKSDRLQAQILQGAIGIVVAVVAAMIGAAKLGLLGG